LFDFINLNTFSNTEVFISTSDSNWATLVHVDGFEACIDRASCSAAGRDGALITDTSTRTTKEIFFEQIVLIVTSSVLRKLDSL
jgi:hypothetical protein